MLLYFLGRQWLRLLALVFGLPFVLLIISLTGCDRTQGKDRDRSVQVVVSIRPLALLVEPFLDPSDELSVLLDGSQSPHQFSLLASDRVRLDDADLMVWVGADMERPLAKVARLMPERSLAMQDNHGHTEHHTHAAHYTHDAEESSHNDAHIWLSPSDAKALQRAFVEWLSDQRPEREAALQQGLRDQHLQMEQSVKQIQNLLDGHKSTAPYAAAHQAFDYFLEAFDVPEPLVLTLSPELPSSAKVLSQVERSLVAKSCILVESGNRSGWLEALAERNDFRLYEVDLLAEALHYKNYSDWLIGVGNVFASCLKAVP